MDRVKNSKIGTWKICGGLVLVFGLVILIWRFWPKDKQVYLSPEAPWLQIEKPLEKYAFENLRKRAFGGSEIKKEELLYKTNSYEAWLFSYLVDGKKVTGQLNQPVGGSVPFGRDGWPVVVMLRGFVDQEIYETGVGTKNGASYFASNGYMTLAPDFLGFGESDMPPNNVFEERFLRPVQVLELLASIKNMEGVDPTDIQIWAHSNGGQLALSVLEISGADYPTSLWAPVSKPFPYSILYFTDEFDDEGKALRKVLAGLEVQYNVDDFDITKHYDLIKAPIQIHQGNRDDAVPLEWSRELESDLKKLEKQVELFVYDGADHNLVGGWDVAMRRSLEWFGK